jgi:hypothetical protein
MTSDAGAPVDEARRRYRFESASSVTIGEDEHGDGRCCINRA